MIRFGIIGAGNIAHRFAKALSHEPEAELYAISGRNKSKLEAFSEEYPVKNIFLSHEELISCPEINAVYIALPHDLHKEWAVRALRAGKAVLTEKPAAMSQAQMLEIAQEARKSSVLFMEAQKARFVPLYREFKKRLDRGDFGEIRAVSASLCNAMPTEKLLETNTYHYQPGVGGALLDCGTYCASILEDLTTRECGAAGKCGAPEVKSVFRYGVDVYAKCEFMLGKTAVLLETAFDRAKPRNARVLTDRGEIIIEELHRPEKMVISLDDKEPETVEIPYEYDDFYSQIHHFVGLLLEGKKESPIMPPEASIRIAAILDYVKNEIGKKDKVKKDIVRENKNE